MIQRATDDRRVKKLKVDVNRRKIRRRKEDRANVKSYYAVLGLSCATLLVIGTISFIWG